MNDNVIRICDHERKSREPDAVSPRDPADATIIILPVERYDTRPEHNEMIIARIRGAPACAATPESDRDPQNPNAS